MPYEELITRLDRRLGDRPASITIVSARVIRWKHLGNACDRENTIVQLKGDLPRRERRYIEAKCGGCHQTVRLYQVRDRKRYTIDPNF
jgi:hypothetical protein